MRYRIDEVATLDVYTPSSRNLWISPSSEYFYSELRDGNVVVFYRTPVNDDSPIFINRELHLEEANVGTGLFVPEGFKILDIVHVQGYSGPYVLMEEKE